jgi:hypothetical protein
MGEIKNENVNKNENKNDNKDLLISSGNQTTA